MWQIEEILRRFFKELESVYGLFNLVALIPNKGNPDLVDILICADWFPRSDKKTVAFLDEKVLKHLTKEVLSKISAIIPIPKNSPINASPEHLESMIAQYFDLENEQVAILLPDKAQEFLDQDGIYHPQGSFRGVDGQYHPPGSFRGVDGQYYPPGSFRGVDGQYHPPGSFRGVDGQYHPQGSFRGVDGQYHPQGSFRGVDGQYHPPLSFLGLDGKYHPKGSYLGPNGKYIEPSASE